MSCSEVIWDRCFERISSITNSSYAYDACDYICTGDTDDYSGSHMLGFHWDWSEFTKTTDLLKMMGVAICVISAGIAVDSLLSLLSVLFL